MRRDLLAVVVVLVVAAAGCSSTQPDGAAGSTRPIGASTTTSGVTTTAANSDPTQTTTTSQGPVGGAATGDAAAVNSAVPAGVQIEFVAAEVMDETIGPASDLKITAVVPMGWEFEGGRGLEWQPVAGSEYWSIFTTIEMRAMCQGACAPRDWETVIEDPERTPFAASAFDGMTVDLERDLSAPEGRTLIFHDDRKTYVQTARWDNGADSFFFCEVTLLGDDQAHAALFAAACEQSVPQWF